jgi:hypothetical protein
LKERPLSLRSERLVHQLTHSTLRTDNAVSVLGRSLGAGSDRRQRRLVRDAFALCDFTSEALLLAVWLG